MNNSEMKTDYYKKPYTANLMKKAIENTNYRTVFWTGCHIQMTLMCIPVCSDIGMEIHNETDQLIRVEQGMAMVEMGECKDYMDFQERICVGDMIFIPAGTWHNVTNCGRIPLKLSVIYAPPHHKVGTVHHTKKDGEMEYK